MSSKIVLSVTYIEKSAGLSTIRCAASYLVPPAQTSNSLRGRREPLLAVVETPVRATMAEALRTARDRLLELGATEEQMDRAQELRPGTLEALVGLNVAAESYEEAGSTSPSLCQSLECREKEIIAWLSEVEHARADEQDELKNACGEGHRSEVERMEAGGSVVWQETGRHSTYRNGDKPPAIVKELALMMRNRHPETYNDWFRRGRGKIWRK